MQTFQKWRIRYGDCIISSLDGNWVKFNDHIAFDFNQYICKFSDKLGYSIGLGMSIHNPDEADDKIDTNSNYPSLKYLIVPDFCTELMPSPMNFSPMLFPEDSMYHLTEDELLSLKDMHTNMKKKKRETIADLTSDTKQGNVYLIWIVMWSLTFKYCNNVEKYHRVNQLNAVLDIFRTKVPSFKKWDVIFEDILRVIQRNGDIKMIIRVSIQQKQSLMGFTIGHGTHEHLQDKIHLGDLPNFL